MKNIYKIVLTGGPAAGKTTLLTRIVKEFGEKGYRVLVVPETATDLISGFGIKPFGNCIDLLKFQDFVFKFQIMKETMAVEAAMLVPEEKVLIIYDRGLIDNKAYITSEEFNGILKTFGLTEVQVRDRYQAVIHLVSSANGAAKFYNLDNAARTETIEQACELDKKTLNAWIGHSHLKIVDNSTNFEDKIDKAMNEIYHIVGEPAPIEIERKFLIKMPSLKSLGALYGSVISDISQHYLVSNEAGEERRIRQRGINGDYSYFYTEKKKTDCDIERVELERILTKDEFLNMFSEIDCNLHSITKKRHCFVFDNQYFELDIYPFNNQFAILEIELTDKAQEVIIPPEIQVVKEVTDDPHYKNYNIAQNLEL